MSAPPSAAAESATKDALSALAEASAWRRGALAWLLFPIQRAAYRSFLSSTEIVFVVLCSRRWGKTFFATVLCWICALTNPGALIRYAAPTKLHGRKFVIPAFKQLAKLAPARYRPHWNSQDNVWTWPNGSQVHLGSCETDADVDAQVGTACRLAVVDESGKIKSHLLEKLIDSILLPQFLTKEDGEREGRCVVLGTPSDSPDHYFRRLVVEAMSLGSIVKHTIDACSHVDQATLAKILKKLGGPESTRARRELYCEFVTEDSRAIIPGFAKLLPTVRGEIPRPRYFDTYVAADMGYTDLTLAAFAYYHFELDLLVIEDELVRQRTGNVAVARDIRKHEIELWGAWREPLARLADTGPQARADMYEETKRDADGNPAQPVSFSFPKKFDKHAGINAVIAKLKDSKILIHPRCVTILAHLEHGIWNESRTEFERVDGHHWDGIPAVSYLLRAVEWGRDPRPLFEQRDTPFFDTGISPAQADAYQAQMRSQTTEAPRAATFVDLMQRKR